MNPKQLITDKELMALYAGERYGAIRITIIPADAPRKPWYREVEEEQPKRKRGRPRKSEAVKQPEAVGA
jgi:hypothetical protein